jgi:hypothetical protein
VVLVRTYTVFRAMRCELAVRTIVHGMMFVRCCTIPGSVDDAVA